MNHFKTNWLWCLALLLLIFTFSKSSKANPIYGIEVSQEFVRAKADSITKAQLAATPFLKDKKVISQVEKRYSAENKSASFYLALCLLLALGLLRSSFPNYFHNLYISFVSPMSSKRSLREQIEQNEPANLAMNILFSISFGLFIFVVLSKRTPFLAETHYSLNLILLGLIVMAGLVYTVKFAVLKLVGWSFKMERVTDDYLYNVFLINKILGIALIPFSIILAFGTGAWLSPILVVSVFVILILILNRYTRSWTSLGSFFQFSKFHFFMYFCASELIPLAILVKLAFLTLA